jgi:chromosome partitioning protein
VTKSGSTAASRSGSSPTSAGGSATPKEGSTSARAGARRDGTRIVAIANQKGGVGKSTTAVSLGAALAEAGRRILVLDLDPQGNASTGMGIRHDARDVTVYDVVVGDAPIEEAIVQTPVPNLWAIPSTIDLAGAEIELVSQFSRELRLRKALEPLQASGAYDYILLDCPPSLGLLTINALAAALELIVPIQCEYYALEGLGQLLRNVGLVQQNINPNLQLTGIVMTMFDPRTKLSEQVVEEVQRYFGDRVYDVIIPRTVRLSEAPGFGQPITVYDPKSKGAESYRRLAHEVDSKPPPSAPMPSMDDLPTVVVAPPPRPEPLPAAEPAELETLPTPTVHDLVAEEPAAAVPLPAPAEDEPARAAPATPRAEEVPKPQAAKPRAPKPAAALKPAAEPKPAATPKPRAARPAAAPEPAQAAAPAADDDEAAVWLEELTLEAEREAAVTSSDILARAAAQAEEELEDDEVWDEEPPDPGGATRPAPASPSDRRVVVIDEDTDIPVPEPTGAGREGEAQTAGARVGATLEDDASRKKRWRLFRKGGE